MSRPGDARGPIRTCVGCRERRPQHELVRIARAASGALRIDRHAPGRGAWICGPACLDEARRRRGFDRAFRTTITPAEIDHLGRLLSARE